MTPFLCPISTTSGLGATIRPSPEEPPQYTSKSTYCRYPKVLAENLLSPWGALPLVLAFIMEIAITFVPLFWVLFTVCSDSISARFARGTVLTLYARSGSWEGSHSSSCSGNQ